MNDSLITDINNYISFLNSTGLYVTVHGNRIGGLLEHNVHNNPFCAFVKTNSAAWEHCMDCQPKIYKKSSEEVFFGMCHAGLEEYVFFVNKSAFVSVSGYGINREKAFERMRGLSQKYCLNFDELSEIYDNGLKHEPEDIEKLKIVIRPLLHMLSMLHMMLYNVADLREKDSTFDSIIYFINRNFMEKISLADIAAACSCSESTVSHIFKSHTGTSVGAYILNLRIEQSKKLLNTSSLSVTEIALVCGFDNSNYFSTAFKRICGVTPSEYRRKS